MFRCSALPKLMTDARSKSEKLSETCKSEIKAMVKEDLFMIKNDISNKYTQKGIEVENQSIELYNEVFFTNHEKNTVRLYEGLLTGECDILDRDNSKVIDIKSSWSLLTFPAVDEDINIKDYEWQLRGYMHLYNVDNAEIAYCMVDTPEALRMYEDEDLHVVSHIDPLMRVTTIQIKRDLELENKMLDRLNDCRDYYNEYLNKLTNKNK